MIRATSLLTVASGVLAWLAMAGIGTAQTTARELSALEVIQYVSSGQPADHARLRDHFVALADRYTADAARHAAMMTTFAGNPNRTSGENLTVSCRRRVERAIDAAVTAAELASYHGLLADGIVSAAPANAWRFEAGEGARQPTDREVRLARLDARTRAQHGALEEYFTSVETRQTARADAYTALAHAYRGNPNRRGGDPAVHLDRMAGLAREAAREARAAAFDHRRAG